MCVLPNTRPAALHSPAITLMLISASDDTSRNANEIYRAALMTAPPRRRKAANAATDITAAAATAETKTFTRTAALRSRAPVAGRARSATLTVAR